MHFTHLFVIFSASLSVARAYPSWQSPNVPSISSMIMKAEAAKAAKAEKKAEYDAVPHLSAHEEREAKWESPDVPSISSMIMKAEAAKAAKAEKQAEYDAVPHPSSSSNVASEERESGHSVKHHPSASPDAADRGVNRNGMLGKRYDPKEFKYPWVNCTAEGTFVGGCNKDSNTAPKEFFKKHGYVETKKQLNEMITEAFKGDRGHHAPRSVCRGEEDSKLCVSWSQGVKYEMRPDQQEAIVDFAMNDCTGRMGMLSSEVRTGFDNNVTDTEEPQWRMVCISSRPSDCTIAPWFCKDLWSWDPANARGQHFKANADEWNNHGFIQEAAHGPCTNNCDD